MPLVNPITANGITCDHYKFRVKTWGSMKALSDGKDPACVCTNLPPVIASKLEGIDCDIFEDLVEEHWRADAKKVAEKKAELAIYL